MSNRKAAIKWAVVLTLVAAAIFTYAYVKGLPDEAGDVAATAPAQQDVTPQADPVSVPVEDDVPQDVPEEVSVIYSEFPRSAAEGEGFTYHHVGGTEDDELAAAYVLGSASYVVVNTESNGYDFCADGASVGFARIVAGELVGTLTLKGATCVSSAITGAGAYLLLLTEQGTEIALVNFDGVLVFRNSLAEVGDDGKLTADGLGVRAYVVGAGACHVLKVDSEGLVTSLRTISYGFSDVKFSLDSLLVGADEDLLFLTSNTKTLSVVYSTKSGVQINDLELEAQVLQILPLATGQGARYFLQAKTGEETLLLRCTKTLDIEARATLQESTSYLTAENGGLLVSSSAGLTYYCEELHAGPTFAAGGVVVETLTVGGVRYFVTESEGTLTLSREDAFVLTPLCTLSGGGNVRLLATRDASTLCLFFNTESRLLDCFGGKDCACAYIPLTAL